MNILYILNENGEPEPCNDAVVWGRWVESSGDVRRVLEDVHGGVRVSTVFLGLDHGFDAATPILYETLVFGGVHDNHMERYATRQAAEEGHKRILAMVKQEE